jgi:hypothetical protein
MDPRSFAHLDKSRLKVMCGSCGKQIALVDEMFYEVEGGTCEAEGNDRVQRIRIEGGSAAYRLGDNTGMGIYVRDGDEFERQVINGKADVYGVLRTLVIEWGCALQPDGTWRLNARAQKRLRQGKLPTVRRQEKVVTFYDGYAVFYAPDAKSVPKGGRGFGTLKVPIRLQCHWCPSVQILDRKALQLSTDDFYIGSDMDDWRKRHGFEEDANQFDGKVGRGYTLTTKRIP